MNEIADAVNQYGVPTVVAGSLLQKTFYQRWDKHLAH